MTQKQAQAHIEDMMSDVARIPLRHLEEACNSYRRDPDKVYFPRGADLFELARRNIKENAKAITGIQRVIEYIHPDDRDKMTPDRMAEIRAEVATEGLSRFPKLKEQGA